MKHKLGFIQRDMIPPDKFCKNCEEYISEPDYDSECVKMEKGDYEIEIGKHTHYEPRTFKMFLKKRSIEEVHQYYMKIIFQKNSLIRELKEKLEKREDG